MNIILYFQIESFSNMLIKTLTISILSCHLAVLVNTNCDEGGIMPRGAKDLDVTKQLSGREIVDWARTRDDCRDLCKHADKTITGCTHAWFMEVTPYFIDKVWNKAGGTYVY